MIFLLTACTSSLLGEWTGECQFADQNQEAAMQVTNQVTNDNGYLLEGSIDLETWEGDNFSGDMIGDHNGKYVMFRSDIETEFGPYIFRMELERVGQELDGNCIIQAPDSVGSLVGDIELQR